MGRCAVNGHTCLCKRADIFCTGYTPPQNLTNYAQYLDFRIRAYKDLKHDPIRVQSENNRDMRAEKLDEESRRSSLGAGGSVGFGNASASGGSMPNRRLTIAGRKLRIMSVEKGLLRETKIVQKMIDVLLECKVCLHDERRSTAPLADVGPVLPR